MTKSGKPLVLIADDDPAIHRVLELHLKRWGYQTAFAINKAELLDRLGEHSVAVLLLDLRLGESDGLEILQELVLRRSWQTAVIILTAHGSIDNAVTALKMGAYDYLTKPIDTQRLQVTLEQVLEKVQLKGRIAQLEKTVEGRVSRPIWGSSQAILRLLEEIQSVAPTNAPVLILGESGTGKELVARAIHEQSPRGHGPFVPLNMAALPQNLVESTLFGHEKGAFTGADSSRKGACEQANGGTLFLDEIGEMDIGLQAKLLRFLQERTVQRVGSTQVIRVDVRIVSATNRDPLELIDQGHFREDLYHRLNVVDISVPPLRERAEDIPELAKRFLDRAAAEYNRPVVGMDDEVLEVLARYHWPGNVRQLENVVARLVIKSREPIISLNQVPEEILRATSQPDALGSSMAGPGRESPSAAGDHSHKTGSLSQEEADSLLTPIQRIERQAIIDALNKCGGHVGEAAKALGMGQATVYRKIKTYKIPLGRRRRSVAASEEELHHWNPPSDDF